MRISEVPWALALMALATAGPAVAVDGVIEINQASAARVIMQMLYLENQKGGQDINFYINSPGGAVDDTLAIYDTMTFLNSKVATYCVGRVKSWPPSTRKHRASRSTAVQRTPGP